MQKFLASLGILVLSISVNAESPKEANAQNTWSGAYRFAQNLDSQSVDLSDSKQQIFRFTDCEDSCLVEYEALHKYATCEVCKDDALHLDIISACQAVLRITGDNAQTLCEVALRKTPKGFKAENPAHAIESCNVSLSIFKTCGAGTNPDWTMEFIKE